MLHDFVELTANGDFSTAQIKAVAAELHALRALDLTYWYA